MLKQFYFMSDVTSEMKYKSSAVTEMGDHGHNRRVEKRGEGCRVPFTGSWDPIYYNVGWAGIYFRTKWRLHPFSRLATIEIRRELGRGLCPLWGGDGHHLTQSCLGWGLPPYQLASWSIQPFGRNRYGPKIGGAVPLRGRGSLDPVLHDVARAEAYLHAKFHLDPSNCLATVNQCYRQTDRQITVR